MTTVRVLLPLFHGPGQQVWSPRGIQALEGPCLCKELTLRRACAGRSNGVCVHMVKTGAPMGSMEQLAGPRQYSSPRWLAHFALSSPREILYCRGSSPGLDVGH